MKKFLVIFLFAIIGFASAKQATNSPPTVRVVNDEFNVLPVTLNFVPFVQNESMITVIVLNTQMVLPASINFISEKSSMIGGPITTTEELCAKKDMLIANYSINKNNGKTTAGCLTSCDNKYRIIKHPVSVAVNEKSLDSITAKFVKT